MPVLTDPRYTWQDEFVAKYHALNQQDFTLVACPGSGKTRAALRVAKELLETGVIDFIWIVCPTNAVKKQWWKAAGKVGISLEWQWEHQDAQVAADMDGVVVTFSAVSRQPDLHRYHVSRHRTLVIFDEIHHARDDAAWGAACQHAFDTATRRLMLSGTPFRRDGMKISFLRYTTEDDVTQWVQADYSYDYWRAMQFSTCRFLYFPKTGGRVEWEWRSQQFAHRFEDKLSDAKAAGRLKGAIWADGTTINPIGEQLLRDANAKISQLRAEGDDRAGGLVIAMGKDRDSGMRHANAIADHMERLFGHRPPVVVSDDKTALSKIDAFRDSGERWLVSINMVSEGVDIPRLRVLAYLTNITSELYFNQAAGRVLRGSDDAFFFIPADELLQSYAQRLAEQRKMALEAIAKAGSADPPDGDWDPSEPSEFKSLGGEAEDAGVIFGSHRIDRAEYITAQQHLQDGGWPPPVPHEVVGKFIIAQRQQRGEPAPDAGAPGGLKSERKERLRKAQNRLVSAYCLKTGREHSHVNAELNTQVGIQRIKHATEDQLIARFKLAKELYDSVQPHG